MLPLFLVALAANGLAIAQDAPAPRPKLPRDVQVIVDLARSGPPEIFADTIVRLIETGRISNQQLQREFLDDAFTAAKQAKEPIRLHALLGMPPDTRAIFRSKAGELGLDALSLQSKVIRTLMSLDRPKARTLFESIPRPVVETRPCEDPFVADASAYYRLAVDVAQGAFKDAEKQKELHVQFLRDVLSGITAPGDLAAFISALESVSLSPAQLKWMVAEVAAKAGAMPLDYRAFIMNVREYAAPLGHLNARAAAEGVGGSTLAESMRWFLTTQLGAPRCKEEIDSPESIIEWFNKEFRGAVRAIRSEDTVPLKKEGEYKAEPYFQGDAEKKIAEAFSKVRVPPGAAASPERSMAERRLALSDFLRDYQGWRPPGADIDQFHQRMVVLRGLFEMTPSGELRDRVTAECIRQLGSNVQRTNPAEWLWQVKSLVEGAGYDTTKIFEVFRNSGNSGLILYAAINPK